jgi:transposase
VARELFAIHATEYAQLQAQIEEVEGKLMAWHKTDACSRRLARIPGAGPIGAAMLSMKTPAPEMFRSGRQFAACIGLTPKDHSTAGKGGSASSREPATRACAAYESPAPRPSSDISARSQSGLASWLEQLLKRKPPKLAAVAAWVVENRRSARSRHESSFDVPRLRRL